MESNAHAKAGLLIAPDFAICPECRREMRDPNNRRFAYPFITCTLCGPRYSILEALPYDRHTTTMRNFQMCPECLAEYHHPEDRRYFAQTNSCPTCGIQLTLCTAQGDIISKDTEVALHESASAIAAGQILALKGIGGYLLICDACNAAAVATLRRRKNRPHKPFALLYPNLEILQGDAMLRTCEQAALESAAAPIVLLPLKSNPRSGLAVAEIIPENSGHIGVMLPYAPLLERLSAILQRPLVATSGNCSGSPIAAENDAARAVLESIADLFLQHNRDIALAQDDSVLRFSARQALPVWLRRARGLAPSLLLPGMAARPEIVFCSGADMKSAFAWVQDGNYYVSPYLGALNSYEVQARYRHTLDHFEQMLGAQPQVVLADRHPDYAATHLAAEKAETWGVPLMQFFHHEAHFAAVLAENALVNAEFAVMGIIWDGTGYGEDGSAWGGEFFIQEKGIIQRVAHLQPFPLPGGDQTALQPRLAALALTRDLPEIQMHLQSRFSALEWNFYQKALRHERTVQSSSVGRLFDAVAALLDLGDRNSFEGQAAMALEALADVGQILPENDYAQDVFVAGKATFDYRLLLQRLWRDKLAGQSPSDIAFTFHVALTEFVRVAALHFGVKHLAFSGGVFQNALLCDLLIENLSSEYRLFFHKNLSPNDECIPVGQWVLWQKGL